jgi:hypothetical protein
VERVVGRPETYSVMATATDAHGYTSHAWGEFTTLSQRDASVELGAGAISGGPGNISTTEWQLGLDGPRVNVIPGELGINSTRACPAPSTSRFG